MYKNISMIYIGRKISVVQLGVKADQYVGYEKHYSVQWSTIPRASPEYTVEKCSERQIACSGRREYSAVQTSANEASNFHRRSIGCQRPASHCQTDRTTRPRAKGIAHLRGYFQTLGFLENIRLKNARTAAPTANMPIPINLNSALPAPVFAAAAAAPPTINAARPYSATLSPDRYSAYCCPATNSYPFNAARNALISCSKLFGSETRIARITPERPSMRDE